jgi:hypothetical protein
VPIGADQHGFDAVNLPAHWIFWELRAMDSGPGNTYGNAVATVDDLKASPHYQVLTPCECLRLITGLQQGAVVTLRPLMGGIHPDDAWASLELFTEQVLPQLDPIHGAAPRPN